MVQLVKRASDVRITEINLSQIILGTSSAVGCIAVISNQGSTLPRNFTNFTDFTTEYGPVNPKISFSHYCAKDFFAQGNNLWAIRAVGTGALTAGVVAYLDSSSNVKTIGYSVANPLNFDWAVAAASITTLTSTTITENDIISFFYSSRGPGSYASVYDVEVSSSNTNFTFAAVLSAAATSFPSTALPVTYRVTAVTSFGEILSTSPATVSVSSTQSANLTWSLVPGATSYRVYSNYLQATKTTGSALQLVTTLGGADTSFTDTGVILQSTTLVPTVSATSPSLTVNVYATDSNTSVPAESFDATLSAGVNGQGIQTELESRINPFSSYIQVISNVPALPAVPTIYDSSRATCTGGNSGTAPTSSNAMAAMQVFLNKNLYGTNLFMSAGLADPVTGLTLDTIAQTRGDAVALLEVPSGSQKYTAAIDYRNNTLNLNSTYSSLFCPDVLESDLVTGQQLYIPFSGMAGALCAHTDAVASPAWSIAGLNRGIVNILKPRYHYDDGQATQLYNAQVNYIRTFVGQGNALWEQQTLSGQNSALSWLSVRRIINVIKSSTYSYLLYALQEMETDSLRRSIVNQLSQYLQSIKDAAGIYDFTVVCDESNNPPVARNAGVLVISVIIIPNIPIHEVQLNVGISKAGVAFSEVLNQVK